MTRSRFRFSAVFLDEAENPGHCPVFRPRSRLGAVGPVSTLARPDLPGQWPAPFAAPPEPPVVVQLLTIVRNTFFESIRQPIMIVLLIGASLALVFSNILAAYTMEDDHKMMIDMGLATIFLSGTLVAAFIATNVVSREIDNRTVLTVISKPVGRPLFIIGKYLGVAGAIAVATLYMILVFLLTEMHGTMQTARDPYHLPVILFGFGAGVVGCATALWCNYFYGMVFASTALCVTTPLLAIAYVLALMFGPDFATQAIATAFRPQVWLACAPLLIAILVLTAIAVAVSTRAGQVLTLAFTVGIFLLGMMSDTLFGQPILTLRSLWLDRAGGQGLTTLVTETRTVELVSGDIQTFTEQVTSPTIPLVDLATTPERLEHATAWLAYAVVPNFQVFWLSDAVTQEHVIPVSYVGITILYGLLLITAALGVATMLFQKREVG
jgi:ABC-2 type transport system permease protein